MGIPVISTLEPQNAGDFPVAQAGHLLGGYQSVADATARNAIPAARRVAGLLVRTNDDGVLWMLAADLTSWRPIGRGLYDAKWFGTGVLDLYVDPAGGSDSNDGLTAGTPLLNVQTALDMVPDGFTSDCVIHVAAGTFTAVQYWNLLARPGMRTTTGGQPVVVVMGDTTTVDVVEASCSAGVLVPGKAAQYTVATAGWAATINDDTHWSYFTPASGPPTSSFARPLASVSPTLTIVGGLTAGQNLRVCPWNTVFSGATRILAGGFAAPLQTKVLRVLGIKFSAFSTCSNVELANCLLTNSSAWSARSCSVYASLLNGGSSSLLFDAGTTRGAVLRGNLILRQSYLVGSFDLCDTLVVRALLGINAVGPIPNVPTAARMAVAGIDFEGAGSLQLAKGAFFYANGDATFVITGAPLNLADNATLQIVAGKSWSGSCQSAGLLREGAKLLAAGATYNVLNGTTPGADLDVGTGGVRAVAAKPYSDAVDFCRYT